MSHFTEALYLKRQLEILLNEHTLLKAKLHYLLEAAPPVPPKGLPAPSPNPASTVVGHVFVPPTLSNSPMAGQSEMWINYVFNNLINLQSLCQGAANCIWSNPNVQNAFAQALLDWLDANNINQAQMLDHLSRWDGYTSMLNYINTLSPGQAQEYFRDNPQWQNIFSEMNSPAFQQALESYYANLNEFLDLLNRFRQDLANGGIVDSGNLFYNFHMQANTIALGQLDSYAKQLEEQLRRFRGYAESARPLSYAHRNSLTLFNMRLSRFIDSLGRGAGLNYSPAQLAEYIRAILNGDQEAIQRILRTNPWVQGLASRIQTIDSAQLEDLLARLQSAQNSQQMYMAIAAVLGIVVASFIIAYIYNYFANQTQQQSGGYNSNP